MEIKKKRGGVDLHPGSWVDSPWRIAANRVAQCGESRIPSGNKSDTQTGCLPASAARAARKKLMASVTSTSGTVASLEGVAGGCSTERSAVRREIQPRSLHSSTTSGSRKWSLNCLMCSTRLLYICCTAYETASAVTTAPLAHPVAVAVTMILKSRGEQPCRLYIDMQNSASLSSLVNRCKPHVSLWRNAFAAMQPSNVTFKTAFQVRGQLALCAA